MKSTAATFPPDPENEINFFKNRPLGSDILLDSTIFDGIIGEPLSYEWYGPFSSTTGENPSVYIPEGIHAVTLFTYDSLLRSDPYTEYFRINPSFSLLLVAWKTKVFIIWHQVQGAERYDIYRAEESNPSKFEKITELPGSKTIYTDSNLSDATYLYVIGALSNGQLYYSQVRCAHPYLNYPKFNYPPVIYSAPITTAIVGLPYTYDVQVADPLVDALTYTLVSPPPGMKIDSHSGLIEWVPLSLGDYEIVVKVKNYLGSYKVQKFIIEVDELPAPNRFPVAHAGGPYTSEVEQALSFDGSASYDPDGDSLLYAWSFGDGSHGSGVAPSHLYSVSGTYQVTLTVSDSRGGTASDTTTASVHQCLQPTVQLSANPAAVLPGEASALIWTSENATTVSIDHGIGTVGSSGTIMVHPQTTTTYTITATSQCGISSKSISVIVHQPPTVDINASPGSTIAGQTALLSWNSTNADTVTIDQGIGSVMPNGSLTVSPMSTTNYTVTATGPGGTITDSVILIVHHPPIVDINAAPDSIVAGQSSQLSWTSANADTVTIDQGIGTVNAIGSLNISLDQTTTYTITATGAGGIVTDTVTVTVYQPPRVSISAEPQTIIEGETSTLTWASEYADTASLDNGVGTVPLNSSLAVSLPVTSSYTITVQGPGGTATASTTITVLHKPTVTISASPDPIDAGETTTLTWNSTDADAASIDQGIGNVDVNGNIQVSPNETTTYTIIATGPGGIATACVTVEVNSPELPRKTCAYIPNGGGDDVTVVDLSVNSVLTHIPVGLGPYGVAVSPDGDRVYVTCGGDGWGIYIINAATNTVIGHIEVYADIIAASPDGSIIYAVSFYDGTLTAINADSHETVRVMDVGVYPYGIAVNPNGTSIYVTSFEEGNVRVIDTSSFNVIDIVQLSGMGTAVWDVEVSPDGSYAYVASRDNRAVYVIDTSTHSVVDEISIVYGETILSPLYLAVSPDGNRLYASCDGGYISAIDIRTHEVISSISAEDPSDLSFTPDGLFVYVPDYLANGVMAIDSQSNKVIAFIGDDFSFPATCGHFIAEHREKITGRVVVDGAGVGGIKVALSDGTITRFFFTDSMGRYFFYASPGQYTISFVTNGYVFSRQNVSVSVANRGLSIEDTEVFLGVRIWSDPVSITSGQSAALHWDSMNATRISIDQEIGEVGASGTQVVSPLKTTTYTITAIDSQGRNTVNQATVTVYQRPTVSLTAEPQAIIQGQSTTLTWTSANADTLILEPYGWDLEGSGSQTAFPHENTTYTITATGLGGTATASVTVTVMPPPITITAPFSGESIYRPDVMVTGTISNTFGDDVSITVNSMPAIIYGYQYVANHIPLEDGDNTIMVTATDSQGHTAEESITVHAATTGPCINLTADDESGSSPLQTTLRIDASFTTEIPLLNAVGPGQVEYLTGSTSREYNSRITGNGIYYFTAEVIDVRRYSDTIGIVVFDQAEIDSLLKEKWNGMKSRLINSDVNGALEYFALPSKDEYQEIFTRLSSELPAIATNMEDIEKVYIRENVAKYRIKKNEEISGVIYRVTHYIYFVHDAYGNWYIDSF